MSVRKFAPFVALAVLLIASLACNKSEVAGAVDTGVSTAVEVYYDADATSVAIHSTYVVPVEATQLAEINVLLNGTQTPTPVLPPAVIPMTPTPTAIVVNATTTICGAGNSAQMTKLVKVEVVGADNSIVVSLDGVWLDPIGSNVAVTKLGFIITNLGNGCISAYTEM